MKHKPTLEPFLKVPLSLIDNEVLTSTEKCLLMLLIRLRTAKKGCVPSYAYLKKKLKIKDDRTITRALDRLMSQKQKNIYNQRLRDNFVNKQGIKVINN
jgi:hypothetical protein